MIMKEDFFNIIKEAGKKGITKFRVKKEDGKTYIMRLFISTDGFLCEFQYRSRRKGWHISTSGWLSIEPCNKTETDKVILNRAIRNLKRISNLLEVSNMWTDKKEGANILLKQPKEKLLENYKKTTNESFDYKAVETFLRDLGCHFSVDLFHNLFQKRCIVKVPYSSDLLRKTVKCAIKEGVSFNSCKFNSCNDSYDHSVEIQKEDDNILRGWYSKEYRNCCNGYYYILLDSEYALFCEKD